MTQALSLLVIPFTGRFFYLRIKKRLTGQNIDSNTGLYFLGFIGTMSLVCIAVTVNNAKMVFSGKSLLFHPSCISDVHMNFITGICVFVAQFALAIICVIFNAWRKNDGTVRPVRKCCYNAFAKSWTFIISTLVLVYALGCTSFHAVFIFMALIAAPIEVGSLLLLYITALFVLTMFLALILKGVIVTLKPEQQKQNLENFLSSLCKSKRTGSAEATPLPAGRQRTDYGTVSNSGQGQSTNQQARPSSTSSNVESQPGRVDLSRSTVCYIFDAVVVLVISLLVLAALILYLTFYYEMAITVEPYTSQAGFLESFGTLIPAIFASIIGFMAKKFITFVSENENTPGQERQESA